MSKQRCICENCGKQYRVPRGMEASSVSCSNCGEALSETSTEGPSPPPRSRSRSRRKSPDDSSGSRSSSRGRNDEETPSPTPPTPGRKKRSRDGRDTSHRTPTTHGRSASPLNKDELKQAGSSSSTNGSNTKVIVSLCSLGLILVVGILAASTGSSDAVHNTSRDHQTNEAETNTREETRNREMKNWNPGGRETKKAKRRQEGRQNNPLSD